MTTRAYDVIVNANTYVNFNTDGILHGRTTNAIGTIVSVNIAGANANLKVKLENTYKTFSPGEIISTYKTNLYSVNNINNVTSLISTNKLIYPTGVANALEDSVTVYVNMEPIQKSLYSVSNNNIYLSTNTYLVTANSKLLLNSALDTMHIQVTTNNTNAYSFVAANITSTSVFANGIVLSTLYSPYIADKNSVQQTPIVRLFSIYYPGEWYPPNANGNPSRDGTGYPWPYGFPLRFAEINGDLLSDNNASVIYDNVFYKVIAVDGGSISTDSSGSVSGMSLEISNIAFDMAKLIDNKNLVGKNTSNSVSAYVNGELLLNIDPRTVPTNPSYNTSIVALIGQNAAIDYSNSITFSGNWIPIKRDSRDLLRAVVEVKSVASKFLDFWPEYSTLSSHTSNSITVQNPSIYRLNDNISVSSDSAQYTITNIINNTLYVTPSSLSGIPANYPVRIINPAKDNKAHTTHTFIISQLEELNDFTTKFSLTTWLQYFKMTLPSRKFYLNTCPWAYKGAECKYTGSGSIIGAVPPLAANGYFNSNNVPVVSADLDSCAKTYTACRLRNNMINFGGFLDVET